MNFLMLSGDSGWWCIVLFLVPMSRVETTLYISELYKAGEVRERVRFCKMLFFASFEKVMWNPMPLYSINMVYCIDSFFYVEPTLLSWDKSYLVLVWYMILLMCCWIQFGSILRIFASLFIRYYSSFLVMSLYQSVILVSEWVKKCCLLFYFP